MSRRAAVLAALVLAGCATRRPTYVPLDVPLPAQPAESEEAVRDSLRFAMERGRMPRLTWSPRPDHPARSVDPSELHRVPSDALWVAWVCSPRRMWGSELDVLLADDTGPVPLTVQVETDGSVHLARGEAPPALDRAPAGDRGARMRSIAQRHGLRGVVDGDRAWSAEELDVLDAALDLLDPRERLLLADLLVSRSGLSHRDPRELALYDPVGTPAVIHVFDSAFAAGKWSFVGPADAPRPAALMTLIHEFGHVLSDAPVREAWDRFAQARWVHAKATGDRSLSRRQLLEARTDLRLVGRRGPVIGAFARLRPGRLWPTAWSTDVFEAFAEAYALYRTDPEALQRVAPDAHAWFEADGHLAWRQFPE